MEFNVIDLSIIDAVYHDLSPTWLQKVMIFVSAEPFFIITSSALILFTIKLHRKKAALKIFFLLATVGATDAFSAHVLKPFFGRLRPCQVFEEIVSLTGCAGLYSFPSNHASNTMAVAMFVFLCIHKTFGKVLFAVSFVVGWSRMVIGVHYPTDILFGFSVGAIIAFGFSQGLRKFESLQVASDIK